MYSVFRTNSFEKDIKVLKKRGKDFTKLKAVIENLEHGSRLHPKHRDHKLSGNWDNFKECHVEPDWLLIYRIRGDVVELTRTGTHSDLF